MPEMKRDAEPYKPLTAQDVTEEYRKNATPGQGEILYDHDYQAELHQAEIRFALWLHDTLGGNIHLLEEVNRNKISTPDYLWRGKAWDLKTTSTEKSADAAVRHGLRQIKENPGGIFLDYRGKKIDIAELKRIIDSRMRHSKLELVDVMAILDGGTIVVFRYNK